MSAITRAFIKAQKEKRSCFIPYFILGLPDLKKSIDYIIECSPYYDLIELGIPFTDPIADGSTIQEGSQIALKNKYQMNDYFDAISTISSEIKKPIIIMLYFNQIYGYGTENFIKNALKSGVSGLIVPDLLPESDKEFIKLANDYNIETIFLATPVTKEKRLKLVLSKTKGFLYLTSVVGVTGERDNVGVDMKKFTQNIKKINKIPVCIGFGVSSGENVKNISSYADGVIVGSAIVRKIINNENPKSLIESMFLSTKKIN